MTASRSAEERIREAAEKFDEISLSTGPRLLVETTKVGLDRRPGNAERFGDFGYAADLDDGEKYAKLGRCELVGLGDRLGWRRPI